MGGPADTRALLDDLVRNFDRDAAKNGRQMRDLMTRDRAGFCSAATQVLRTQEESRGSRHLLSTLLSSNLLPAVLCDPALSQSEAVALARSAACNCAMVDVVLAKHLSETLARSGHSAQSPELQRLMEILCEISDGARILPSLIVLARLPNPYLQSKAVLMIGRANKSVKWVQQRLTAADSRVRANAVEALWGVDSEDARELLHKSAQDGNNRVAGNAMLGLYQLGDPSVIPLVLKMAEHPAKRFRATAAWVMGESASPRFTRPLARLIAEPNAIVRTRAFKALGQLRAATAAVSNMEPWRVAGRFQRIQQNGWRRVQVEVSTADGMHPVRPLPTHFVLNEDGQTVASYAVDERTAPETLSIAFILPRQYNSEGSVLSQGIVESLARKRPADLWACAFYVPTQSGPQASLAGQDIRIAPEGPYSSDGLPLAYASDPAAAQAAFLKVPSRIDCTDLWNGIQRAVMVDGGPARGQRHVIVYGQHESVQPTGYAEIGSAARNARATVHAISLAPNPLLENLCQLTQGTSQIAASEAEVPALVAQICHDLTARYTIRYLPACPTGETLTIRVQSSAGWGEATLPIPRGC